MTYEILYKKSVDKDLRKLSTVNRRQVIAKIQLLATSPFSPGVTKLRGSIDLYRLRHGDYRIIYQVKDKQLIIIVIKIGHRREVYRDF